MLTIVLRTQGRPNLAHIPPSDLVLELKQRCILALSEMVPKHEVEKTPYALLDFPFYANIGDSAIWAGSRIWLEEHHGAPPAYVSTTFDLSTARLDRLVPDGPIYIKGGGNFGDLYPAHHRFRFELVRRYGSRVVHLPQSLHFNSNQAFEDTKELSRLGSNLMVRDHPSFEAAKRLGFEPKLVPDAAFCIGPQPRIGRPDRDLLVLKRTDREDTGDAISGVDWGGEVPLTWAYAALVSAIRNRRLSKLDAFDVLTQMRVHRGFSMLSRGRAVATDRLHGHIMSVLLGIPHFVSDNSTGKLTAFGEAWTFAAGFAHRRTELSTITRSEAQAIAR